MCRNIKKLRIPGGFPTDAEIHEASLQFIRKVSGYRKPSRRNQITFDLAVEQVANITKSLLNSFEDNVQKSA